MSGGPALRDAWLSLAHGRDALEDRCCHRRVPLSAGRANEDGLLQCPYHGWCCDGAGRVARIPSLPPERQPPASFGVATCPVEVRYGPVELVEEREIDVHLRVGRTVEWPDRRAGQAAGRLHGLLEEHQARALVAAAALREDLAPHVLGRAEHSSIGAPTSTPSTIEIKSTRISPPPPIAMPPPRSTRMPRRSSI